MNLNNEEINNNDDKINALNFVTVNISNSNQPQIVLEGIHLIEHSNLILLPNTLLAAKIYNNKIVIENISK